MKFDALIQVNYLTVMGRSNIWRYQSKSVSSRWIS